MARLTGPDESCRLAYLTNGIARAQGLEAVIYSDEALTTLADIQTTGGAAIADSTLTVDSVSKIPLFKFPDGVDTVYASVNGGAATPLYARTDDRLDSLATRITAVEEGGDSAALVAANNLSDLASASTARTNLGLGGAATLAVGTTAGTVAAGDDSRITGAAQKSSNLSDLANAGTARTNLGLGDVATLTVATATPTADRTATAGAASTLSRGDHNHPRSWWAPADSGLLAAAFDPDLAASGFQLQVAGTMYVTRLHLAEAASVTSLVLYCNSGGTTLTAGQCFAALYEGDGTLVGVTADQATNWQSSGSKTMALAGGPFSCAAGYYLVGFWANGTSLPQFARGTALSAQLTNIGISSSPYRHSSADTGLTTTAPSTLGAQTAHTISYWAALS